MNGPTPVTTETFEREVLRSEIPVLVDFFSPLCMPCQMLGPMLEEAAPEFAGRVKVAQVNVTQDRPLARQFSISAVPTLILFRGGRAVGAFEGLPSPEELRAILESAEARKEATL